MPWNGTTIPRRCALPCTPKTAHFTPSNYRIQVKSCSRNCIILFPKSHRLHQAEEFSSVIRFRCSASSEFLQIFAKPNNLVHPRLGLIVAGKIERLAVHRNRVKRLLREVFRARQRDLAGLDLVVRVRCRVTQSSSLRMVREAEKLMIQLQRCLE